ncbi:voltage-dependent chloride channel 1, chloroplastic-like isoform X1 [Curcuma longa]|uniref:voltage-dependent chloride channel 1, chloroplastic-like isoform X1 n=1 Tax=Curcuma longa TaxID=136217 RepID=UPI003D9F182B
MAKIPLPPHSFPFRSGNPNHLLFAPRIPPRAPHILCSSSDPPTDADAPSLVRFLRSFPDWSDAVKELGMRKRRHLYTPDDWRAHRSSRRHLRHLLSSLSSRVILSLIPPVSVLTAVAAAVTLYNSAVANAWLPPGFFPQLRSSALPYQLTAPALALLLVFRTEASYSRYEEGRMAWMRIMAGASELAGMVMSTKGAEEDSRVKQSLLNYIMAFPVALKCHVISGSDIKTDLNNLLEVEDLAVILRSKHHPHCVIEFISQSIQVLHIEEQKRNLLESKLCCFHEGVGVCEQLMGIPIPLSYTRLTSRFLVLWHLTLPVILWDDCKWMVIPATFISAASLFCIEEVGVLIEEPFPMLALDELCKQLQNRIREAIATEHSVHERLLSKTKGHPDGHSVNGWPNSKNEEG